MVLRKDPRSCIDEIGWADKRPLCGNLIEGSTMAWQSLVSLRVVGLDPVRMQALLFAGRLGCVQVGSSVGQGVETILTQIAADAMEVPLDKIT